MKILVIYHDRGSVPGKLQLLAESTRGRNIEIEIIHDVDFILDNKTRVYDAVLLDYSTMPVEVISVLADYFFSDSMVMVLVEPPITDAFAAEFDAYKAANMHLVAYDSREILELVCLEREIPLINSNIKVMTTCLERVERELKAYVQHNHQNKP